MSQVYGVGYSAVHVISQESYYPESYIIELKNNISKKKKKNG